MRSTVKIDAKHSEALDQHGGAQSQATDCDAMVIKARRARQYHLRLRIARIAAKKVT